MERKKSGIVRYILLGALFVIPALIYVFMLVNLQVSGQDYYTMATPIKYHQRTVKVQAMRGEIYDRNGKPLVTNEFSRDIRFEYSTFPVSSDGWNETILTTIRTAERHGFGESVIQPQYEPFSVEVSDAGVLKFDYVPDFSDSVRYDRFVELSGAIGVKDGYTADEAARKFLARYKIVDEDGVYKYSLTDSALLLRYRLDMELSDFSAVSPYPIVEGVDVELISALKESQLSGVTTYQNFKRIYHYPGYASHILGRTGKIQAEDLEYYTEEGYPLDAVVGISGAELAFEKYLHGTDGEILITEDSSGNVIDSEVTKEPVAGSDVYLTIDIGMQMAAEDALVDNVEWIRNESAGEGTHTGEDCNSGALSAISAKTGEVLALASCPTYSLATFDDDLPYLLKDELAPMYNRALEGTFQPGSTFKIGVAMGALDSGVIDENTQIKDEGVYEIDGFMFRCWIYLMYKETHGWVNVTDAIQVSCNYFFYEVGRRLTIEKIDDYMTSFGLGQPTGIELNEKTGILASPEYVEENGLRSWAIGDTLQASIGQSYNLFTPLQMSVYISSVVNNGTRYSAHILSKVCPYGSTEPIYEPGTTVAAERKIKDGVREIVMNAMKNVIEDGSVSEIFEDYPIVIGGKTGTAQVSVTRSDNAIFTAFAPFDDPEIVVASVLEQGNTGSNAGRCVRDVFDYYFNIDENAPKEPDDGGDE